MTSSPGFNKAKDLSRAVADQYRSLKEGCEGRVVRWEWATFVRHSLQPAYFEINKVRPGTPLDGEPDEPRSGIHGYGFDAQGRIMVVRNLTEFSGRFEETFHRYESDGIAQFHFGYTPNKPWIKVAWLSCDDQRRVCSIDTVYSAGNWSSENYAYNSAGRVVAMERTGTDPTYGDIHNFRDIEYDDAGTIVRVYWRYPDGRRVLEFERPSAAHTLGALQAALSPSLADAIVASLAELPIAEPAFALGLHYNGAGYQHRLPPRVAVGLESERNRAVELFGQEAPRAIWNPAEWRTHVAIRMQDRLRARCDSANQDIWQNGRQEEANVFVAALAQRLARAELPLPKTKDFVCYAVNLDNGTYAADVSSQLTPQVARQLRRRGWL